MTGAAGLPPEILLVPLTGHTWGHCGVAIQRDADWLLHAGDAHFHRQALASGTPRCPPGLRAYQRLMEVERSQRLANQERLRELRRAQGSQVQIVCAHDRFELAAAAAAGEVTTPATAPEDVRFLA